MTNHYSCCFTQIIKPSLMQISFIAIIFNFFFNGSSCKLCLYLCRQYSLALLIDSEDLLHTSKLGWVLNSSSSFIYVATTLPTNVSNFLLSFWFGSIKNKDCPWIPLKGIIPGPPYNPNGSQTSGTCVPISDQTSGTTWQLESSESNWPGREAANTEAVRFHPRCWTHTSCID